MKAGYRFFGMIAVAGIAAGTTFAACAEGTSIDAQEPSSGSSSGSGGSGAGSPLPPGTIGGSCQAQEDCTEGKCTTVGNDKFCTVACPPHCPAGTYCALIEGDPICVPDLDQQCLSCEGSIDCKSPSDACLKAPLGDTFCALDCTTMGSCPNGFMCVVGSDYLAGGGSSSSGAGGGADDAGAGDAGKPYPSGVPYKFCVPNSGFSCPCNRKRDGIEHACSVKNDEGECSGLATCDGEEGKWKGCTAQTPQAESCNAKDDNCSGEVDEGEVNALCAYVGPPPPHASWACNAGMCGLGACEPGFTAYPSGGAVEGCPCPVETGEPNDVCSSATNVGAVSDAGAPITITGTLSSDQDVDFWTLDSIDTDENNANSYHVSIDFSAPMPNDEFLLDVSRGDLCSDAPAGPSAGITSYDWCVDGTFAGPNGMEGEAACSATGAVHCGNHSSKYSLRVYRKPGAVGTCSQYSLTVSAKGGDACDFTQKCQ